MATTYDKIATTTLGSASSTITFSSIANSWTDLRLVLVASTTGTSDYNCQINYNGDFSADYSRTLINAIGSTIYSARNANQASLDWVYVLGINPVPALVTYDIFSYAGSTFKTTLITASNDVNSSGNNTVNRTVGLWRDTGAITSITLTASGTTFAVGTSATLYGIKAA
jgi:hypothetical protein